MHKEELIALHQFMFSIKENIEHENPGASFEQYNALKIHPSQVHKSKMEHKHAIFVLGEEIAEAMKEVEPSASKRIAARMSELARRTEKEIDENPDEKY